jgi:hypothetical protein
MTLNFNYSSSSSKDELIDLYIKLRTEAPVFWSEEHKSWIISRYEDVVAGLGDHRLFTYENTDSFVVRDLVYINDNKDFCISDADKKFFQVQLPPEYTAHRKQLLNIYNKQLVNNLELKVDNNINMLFSLINKIDEVDIKKEVTDKIPLLTICELMGYDYSKSEEVFKITSSLMERKPAQDRIEICKKAYEFIKSDPPKLIIDSEDRKVAISFCMGMMLGGSSSMTGAFPNLLFNIYNHRDQFDLVINNNLLINNFIQETLRHTFIQSNLIRTASADCELHGVKIKKGDTVAFLMGSANFDESRFGNNAKDFNINRNYKRINLAFGHGMYRCIGFSTGVTQLNSFMNFIINNYNYINVKSFISKKERDYTGSSITNIYGSYNK